VGLSPSTGVSQLLKKGESLPENGESFEKDAESERDRTCAPGLLSAAGTSVVVVVNLDCRGDVSDELLRA
jgi:hypothetical protein